MSIEDSIYPLLSTYTKAPQWVKSVVGTAYSALPLSWRKGAAYAQFRAMLGERDSIRLAEYSRRQLGETLQWAVTTVPAYRGLASGEECLTDPYQVLARLPLVTKADIKLDIAAYRTQALRESEGLKTFTGGSTSEPMMFYLHKGVTRAREFAFIEAYQARVGMGEQDLTLAMRGRNVAGAGEPGGRIWMYEPIKRQLILSSDHLDPQYMAQYLRALRSWKPCFIEAFPSAIYPLARWLAEHPDPEITEGVKGVLLYSENVYDYQLELLQRVFRCPVLKHYGHSERVLMAASMPDDDRYFFWPQYGHLELLDKDGNAIREPGVVGEIVGTGFNNRAMPFIRYRTGDMATWSENPGHRDLAGFPVVERIEGRLQEFLVCSDHRLISICSMGAAHFEALAGASCIQYEQKEAGHVTLKVVNREPMREEARDKIVRAILDKTQGGIAVDVVTVNEIQGFASGKQKMLVQHLDVGSYFGATGLIQGRD